MYSVLALSDVILDSVVKEVKESSLNSIIIKPVYSEDMVLKLLSFKPDEAIPYDLVFIHSDQLFHEKDQNWQKKFLGAVNDFAIRVNKKILVSNAFSLSYSTPPLSNSLGYTWDLMRIYEGQTDKLLNNSNVFVFDFIKLCLNFGKINFYNYNLGHLYQMPYTKQGIKAISGELIDQVNWSFAEEKKVIILDCDNTLWKGIVGEDGPNGIACNKDANGILFYNFQLFLKEKKEEGFLLCLCSKNNETDVQEAFDKNNFPLKLSDFIIRKINWEDKTINIANIAKELNVGMESFIFIDDNLFELNSVKELLKSVSCFHLTPNYIDLLVLMNSFLFRRRQILDADREKTKQYEVEQLRKEQEAAFMNMDDFIESLDVKMDISLNDSSNFDRLSQMTGKTNQFNFNKFHYSIDDLKKFIKKNNRVYSLKVSDKYGDYGIVGLILVKLEGTEALLENYLMSCRALGKGIETKFYEDVLGKLFKENINLKDIKFVKTDKNIPAQEFLKHIKV